MGAQMTGAHKRFLQVLMSHGIMEGSEARKLHRRCCELHKGGSCFRTKNREMEELFFLSRCGLQMISFVKSIHPLKES